MNKLKFNNKEKLTNFKEHLKKKDRYYFLAKAILNKDYAKYSIYCQEFI